MVRKRSLIFLGFCLVASIMLLSIGIYASTINQSNVNIYVKYEQGVYAKVYARTSTQDIYYYSGSGGFLTEGALLIGDSYSNSENIITTPTPTSINGSCNKYGFYYLYIYIENYSNFNICSNISVSSNHIDLNSVENLSYETTPSQVMDKKINTTVDTSLRVITINAESDITNKPITIGVSLNYYNIVQDGLFINYDGKNSSHYDTIPLQDISGNNNHAKNANVSWNENGWIGDNTNLKGITLPTAINTKIQNGEIMEDFTIEMMVESTGTRDILFGNYASSTSGFNIELSTSNIIRTWVNGDQGNTTTAITRNTPTLISIVFSKNATDNTKTDFSVYINGTLANSFTEKTFGTINTTYDYNLGYDNRGTAEVGYNAQFYAFRFYDRILTQQELQQNATFDNSRFA